MDDDIPYKLDIDTGRTKAENEAAKHSIKCDKKKDKEEKEWLSQIYINLDDEFEHELKVEVRRIRIANEATRDILKLEKRNEVAIQ